ncbi:MAG: hydantoinase B/oxoprolinase family protein [Chloroflexi bacterium]|nr:hydantoinase B/oxoprolinase family protein [Chloroflexota bacterium]
MTSRDIDPIKFEVMRSAFVEATEEMAATLRRSAYSTNVKTRQDFSCAFFDSDLRVVAQAFTQAVHLGSFVALVPRAIEIYGVENLEPGDMLVINDPYSGGVHLNDVTVIAPFYLDNELIGYFASLAHHVDVGGGAPASVGAFQEVFQEGIIIPPVKLVKRGEINEDVFRLILAQIRSKRETPGDFRAQIAANKTGIRRLTQLIERNGLDEVRKYVDALIDYTRRRTRAELAELPHGTFKAEGFVDNDGFTEDTVHIEVAITIDDDGVVFDTTGSDEQRRAPVNSTFAQTFSACAYALRALIDPDTPVNAGFYEFVRVIAPEGTITNCVHPAPVVGGWETHARLDDIIFKALHQAMPDRVPAGTKAMQCHAGFGGVDPESGEYYCFLETLAGGYGGRRYSDGPDAVQCHGQNTENAPIEETEFNYPVRIPRYELVDDSDGPGRTRGGLGLRRDYVFFDHDVTFTVLADRDKAGPHGLDGGMPGMKASYVLNPDGENVELSSKTTVQLQPGDVISYRTAGGGGFGNPAERPPERVLKDVRDGKISRERASRFYRVAIAEDGGTVDEAATAELRSGSQ